MVYLIRTFLSLIQLLHSESGENSIALGASIGLVLGFSPLLTPQTLLILFMMLLFKVQIGAVILSWLLFSLVALVALPTTEAIGYFLLSADNLSAIWAWLFNIPGAQFTLLNNTLVLGGLIFSLALSPLVYFSSKTLLKKYRNGLGERINNSKLLKLIKASKVYSLYESYSKL